MSLSLSDECYGMGLLVFGPWFKWLGIGVRFVSGGSASGGVSIQNKKEEGGRENKYDGPSLLPQNARIFGISSFCCYQLQKSIKKRKKEREIGHLQLCVCVFFVSLNFSFLFSL